MNTLQSQSDGTRNGSRIRAEIFHCFLLQRYAYSGHTLGQIKKDFYELVHASTGAFLQGDAVQVCLLHNDLFAVTPNPVPDQAIIMPKEYRPLQFMDELTAKEREVLYSRLKGATIDTFDFKGFAAEINRSIGAVYYGALQIANKSVPDSPENPVEFDAVKAFAESEAGIKWANWLVNDLRANGPLNLSAIGNLHFFPENVKATRWIRYISEKMDIDYDFAGGGKDVCWSRSIGRHGAIRNVLNGRTPHVNAPSVAIKPKPMPTVANNPAIPINNPTMPIKDSIQLQKNQRFWGVVDISGGYRDPFGNQMMLIKMLQLEHMPELAGFHLRTSAVDCVSDGEFVVGAATYDNKPFVMSPQNRPIMFREWREFRESRSYPSLEDFIYAHKTMLTPTFSTFAREIFILDAGRVYAGFDIDFKDRTTRLKGTTLRSRAVFGSLYDLGRDFFFLNGINKKVSYQQDEFSLAFAHRDSYQDTDALLADRVFWEELSYPALDAIEPTVEQNIIRIISENGGRIIGPQLGAALQNALPNFSYPYKTFSRLRDLALSIPNVKADPFRDEYFIAPEPPPPPQQQPPPQITTSDPTELRTLAEGIGTEVRWHSQDECVFLENFLAVVRAKCHYSYTSRDIVRFHTAVKSGMLTVLGGDPGTGKSSLIEIYSRALFANRYATSPAATSTFLQISVNPAWAEPADLLGFEGASGKFREARNGLCLFLRQAMEVKENELRVCCFEEINLACVEHYFSDFMQLLSRTHNRIIAGYDRAGFQQVSPATVQDLSKPSASPSAPLELGDNVRFIGTCNFDETVKPMSRRFYDRCHYIELESATNRQFSDEDPQISPECFADTFKEQIAWPTFSSWRGSYSTIADPISRLFSLLTEKLAAIDLMPSFRCVNDIKQYILIRPPNPKDDHERKLGQLQLHALDEAVAQKILSKFRPDPFKSKEQQELYDFMAGAGLTISAQLMDILNKRYKVPTF